MFQHDCEKCIFLGTFDEHDIYICNWKFDHAPDYIARYSSDGPDYWSTTGFETVLRFALRGSRSPMAILQKVIKLGFIADIITTENGIKINCDTVDKHMINWCEKQ